jgi:hypothetical protein
MYRRVAIVLELPIPLEQLERATTCKVRGQMMFVGAAGHAYPAEPMYTNIHKFIEDWDVFDVSSKIGKTVGTLLTGIFQKCNRTSLELMIDCKGH